MQELIKFVPLNVGDISIFSWSDFLTALALMTIAWTLTDVRYQFRLQVAPFDIKRKSFYIICVVGALTLLTDLWKAEHWLVPNGDLLTFAQWEALLGLIVFLLFIVWIWFAFMHPTKFSQYNAYRYADAVSKIIMKSSESEMAVLADELKYSANALIKSASNTTKDDRQTVFTNKEKCANDILQLMGDRRFCRAVVINSSGTIGAIFNELLSYNRYHVPIQIFAKNVFTEALNYKGSFIYHENNFYENGLMGYQKPLLLKMFSNYYLIREINVMLDVNYMDRSNWDAIQLDAYCRSVLIVIEDYINKCTIWEHSFQIYRAQNNIVDFIQFQFSKDMLVLDNDKMEKLEIVVNFVVKTIELLEKKDVPSHFRIKANRKNEHYENYYDYIAELIFKIIDSVSVVKMPIFERWSIQHNAVWAKFFNFGRLSSPCGEIIKHKVRRRLYDKIKNINVCSYYAGTKILSFCLNMFGIDSDYREHAKDHKALKKAILSWLIKNYASLNKELPEIAKECLPENFTFDADENKITQMIYIGFIRRTSDERHLYVNSASVG